MLEPSIVDGELILEPVVCNAARLGDCQRLNSRLRSGGFVNAFSGDDSALVLAVRNRHAACVRELLEWGATDQRALALHAACSAPSALSIVELLLQASASVDQRVHKASPLDIACHNDDSPLAQMLIESGARVNCPENEVTAVPPLSVACAAGSVSVLRTLCDAAEEHGLDIDGPLDGSSTPLAIACSKNEYECARLLIEARASLDISDAAGIARGYRAHLSSTYEPPLLRVCRDPACHADLAELLLEAGADPDKQFGGASALGAAIFWCRPQLVQLLCSFGASRMDVAGGLSAEELCLKQLSQVTALRQGMPSEVMEHMYMEHMYMEQWMLSQAMEEAEAGQVEEVGPVEEGSQAAEAGYGEDMGTPRVVGEHGPPTDPPPPIYGPWRMLAWLQLSSNWHTPLHYATALSAVRTRALLRTGADLHASLNGAPTPLELAAAAVAAAAVAGRSSASARLVIRAAEVWSPKSHDLWPTPERELAREIVRVGYQLARSRGRGLVDAWLAVVMPFVMRRDSV